MCFLWGLLLQHRGAPRLRKGPGCFSEGKEALLISLLSKQGWGGATLNGRGGSVRDPSRHLGFFRSSPLSVLQGGRGLPPVPLSCPSLVSGQQQGPARGQSSAWHGASLFQFSKSFLSLTPTMLSAWFSEHSFSTSTVCGGREGTQ